MSWLLPRVFGRPQNLLCEPCLSDKLPAKNSLYIGEDATGFAPATVAILQQADGGLSKWEDCHANHCGFLLAAWPHPNEILNLLEVLAQLPATTPVALYEKNIAVLPNVLIHDSASLDNNSAASLRGLRSALRSQGRGQTEALVLLPAARLALILRGSSMAVKQPAAGASLQNRRYLHHLLDHSRSLSLLSGLSATETPTDNCRRLILAPHFDDECLLFDDAIHQSQQRGDKLKLLWLTDGGHSAIIRQEEGRAAAGQLGIEHSACLSAQEGNLQAKGKVLKRFREILRAFKPTEVCLPWWLDNHIDHYEATRLLLAARDSYTNDLKVSLSGFWTPLPRATAHPNLLSAINCHQSQLAEVDYAQAAVAAHNWQGWQFGGQQLLAVDDYLKAFKLSGSHKRYYR